MDWVIPVIRAFQAVLLQATMACNLPPKGNSSVPLEPEEQAGKKGDALHLNPLQFK